MYVGYDQYVEPREKYLHKPADTESMYEYLLACYSRISKDLGDYSAFVTPIADELSETPMSVLLRDVEALAAYLAAEGYKEGDVITAFMPTCAHAYPVMLACNKLGLIVNFVHPLTPPDAVVAVMRHTKSKGLFILDAISGYFGSAMELVPTIVCRTSDYCTGKAKAMAQYNEANNVKVPDVPYRLFSDVIANDLPAVPTVKNFGRKDAFYLQGGGTTGKSKTIRLSSFAFNSLAYKYYLIDENHDYTKDYCLAVLPCFHAYGLGGPVFYGLCNAYRPILIAKFDPEQVNSIIGKRCVTEILGVPKMFEKMLDAPNFEQPGLGNFKMLFVGGDLVSEALMQRFDSTVAKFGSKARLLPGYGLTEMSAGVTSGSSGHVNQKATGFPLAGTDLEIWDEDCNVLSCGEIGEIVTSGDQIMNGYLPDENISESGIYTDANGKPWIRTGDMGYLDEEGFLHFSGRKKRIIIIAGYNIYPATIEDKIAKLSYVNEVCVVQGYSDAGKPLAKLCVSLRDPDQDRDEAIAALKKYCEAHFEGFACPRKIEIFDLLPRTKMDKIDFMALSDAVPVG